MYGIKIVFPFSFSKTLFNVLTLTIFLYAFKGVREHEHCRASST